MLHTMFKVQSIHLQAALWMGMSLSQIKKIPSFWEWPPPPLGITEVPGVYFFHLFYVWVSFFHPSRTSLFVFFSSHVGQVFFSLLCAGQVFFLTFEWVKFFFFFFYKNFLLPPLKSNGASLKSLEPQQRSFASYTYLKCVLSTQVGVCTPPSKSVLHKWDFPRPTACMGSSKQLKHVKAKHR